MIETPLKARRRTTEAGLRKAYVGRLRPTGGFADGF